MITLPNGQNPLEALAQANAASAPTSIMPGQQAAAPIGAQPAAPASTDSGQSALAGDRVGQLPTSGFNMSFGQKLAQAADKLGIPQKADGTPQPGGWARSLVGGAQSALAGAAAVGKVPSGAGWLYGASKAAQAGVEQRQAAQDRADKLAQQKTENERQDQRDADAHQLAQLNVDKYHQEKLDHSLDQDKSIADQKVANEQKQQKTFTDAGATTLHSGLDSDQVTAELAKQGIKSWDEHVFADGVQEYEKPDGTPAWRNTYSVISNPPQVTIDKDNADFINKWAPQNVPVQAGQNVTGIQARTMFQQANNASSFFNSVQKARVDSDIEQMTDQQRDEALKLSKDADMTRYASFGKGNPLDTIKAAMSDKSLAQKYPNLQTDLKSVYFGDKEDPSGNKGYNQAIKDREDNEIKLKEDSLKQAEVVPQSGGIMTPALQAQVAKLNPDQQGLLKSYPADTQGSLLATAFGPGDIDFDKVFPARLYKGQAGISSQQAIRTLRELNPNWSEQQYNATRKAYVDATTGDIGKQVEQYNNVLEHGAAAIDAIQEITPLEGKNAPRILRTGLNKLSQEGYGTEISELKSLLQVVTDEFANLTANNYKPDAEEKQAYSSLLSPDATPNQLYAALKAIGATGAIRLENINQKYNRISGQKLPGILTEDAMDAAKHINLDPASMSRLNKLDVGGTLFHNPNWTPPTDAQAAVKSADNQATQKAQQIAQNAPPPSNASKVVKDKAGNILGYAVPGPNGGMVFQSVQGK